MSDSLPLVERGRRGRRAGRPPRPLLVAAAVAGAVALVPLAYLGIRVAEAGWASVVEILARPRLLELTANSLTLAGVVAAGVLLVGVPTAYLVARTTLRAPAAWTVLAALPLAIPSYVAAYAWTTTFPGLFGFWPSALVLTLSTSPYVMLPVAAAFRRMDPGTVDVARALGAGRRQLAMHTVVPQVAPAAAAGALLAVLYVLSDFGSVSILRFDTFVRAISVAYGSTFDRTVAAVLALVLVVLAALAVLGERAMRRRGLRWSPSAATRRVAPRVPLGRWRAVAYTWLIGWAVLGLAVPIGSLIRRLALGTRNGIDWPDLISALGTTVLFAGSGAVLALLLAVPVGVLAARYRGRMVAMIEGAAFVGHALPGIVVGLSLVFLSLRVVPALYQTVAVLAFAYAVLFLPKAIGSTRVAVATVHPRLEEVARSLGHSPLRAWLSVTARVAWPGIAAGGLLVMLTAMKELPATLLLQPTGASTLATRMWSHTSVAGHGSAAPYAIALVLVAALPAFLLARPGRGQPVTRTGAGSEVTPL